MTFKTNPNPTFDFEVAITVPGQAEPAKLSLTFRHKGRKALDEWVKRPQVAREKGESLSDAAYLDEVIAGWAGADAEYSVEALDSVLDAYPAAGEEIFMAYLKALTESRAKN